MSAATSSTQQSNPDWNRVAEEFSNADLQVHPSTTEVMSYFSDDATFSEPGRYNVGKTVAWYGFKILCEWSVLNFIEPLEPTFEQKNDHILWSFKSVQLRKGLLSTWIKEPQWYRIDYAAKLYFTGQGDDTQISRMETVQNDWTIFND